jgi:hypothetical protein
LILQHERRIEPFARLPLNFSDLSEEVADRALNFPRQRTRTLGIKRQAPDLFFLIDESEIPVELAGPPRNDLLPFANPGSAILPGEFEISKLLQPQRFGDLRSGAFYFCRKGFL